MFARWAVLMGIACSGCAVRSVGFVDASKGSAVLVEADGTRKRLVLLGPAAPIRRLDGHFVEIAGQRGLGRIRVTGWRAIEGPHGLPVWVGPVQRYGVQIGIQDLGSDTLVWVDAAAAGPISRHLGDLVAAEGYVEGPQRVHVMYWLPLEGQQTPAED